MKHALCALATAALLLTAAAAEPQPVAEDDVHVEISSVTPAPDLDAGLDVSDASLDDGCQQVDQPPASREVRGGGGMFDEIEDPDPPCGPGGSG